MDISIVIPLYNEEESLPELSAWIERVMKDKGFSYEVLFVNDGSTDKSWTVIENLQKPAKTIAGSTRHQVPPELWQVRSLVLRI